MFDASTSFFDSCAIRRQVRIMSRMTPKSWGPPRCSNSRWNDRSESLRLLSSGTNAVVSASCAMKNASTYGSR